MAGRVAGVVAGLVALLSISVPAHAAADATGGTGITTPPPDPITQPGAPSSTGGTGSAPAPAAPAPRARVGSRPVLTIFNASSAATAGTGALVQFSVRDRARSVHVRLAFVNLGDRTTYRANLGRRRTGMTHSYSWARQVAPGSYRVRITARNARGKKAVRSTTVQVSANPAPATAGTHRFPIQGAYSWGGSDGRFGAPRSGHSHQGQDLAAAEGTPLVAVATGTISWRQYQAGGAGYYLVLDADGESLNYAYMHLQEGSLLVAKGDRVTAGQRIAGVGNTGASYGAHLHFEAWDGPWQAGGRAVDPWPLLKSWE